MVAMDITLRGKFFRENTAQGRPRVRGLYNEAVLQVVTWGELTPKGKASP